MAMIRKLSDEDVSEIVSIINENIDFDKVGKGTTIEKFQHFLDEPNEEIRENSWVAVNDGKIVGYNALCLVKDEALVQVFSYGTIKHDLRRRGIGTKLVKKSLDHLRERSQFESKPYMYHQTVRDIVPGQLALVRHVGLTNSSVVSNYRYEVKDKMSHNIPNGFTFRFPSTEDLEAWVDIYNEAFSWRNQPTPLTVENLIHEFNDPDFSKELNFLCINDQNKAVGFISSAIDEERKGTISTIAVQSEAQGNGVGKALLIEAINRMYNRGVEVIQLSVEQANPTAAIPLYEKNGFIKYMETHFYTAYIDVEKEGGKHDHSNRNI